MYTYPCKVLSVIDGDTLDIELDLGFHIKMKERVRLIGVDTPETYGRYAVPEGKIATDFVIKWVADREARKGDFMYVSSKYNARDKYGRSLGILMWIPPIGDGLMMENLNDDLVRSNNAVVMV